MYCPDCGRELQEGHAYCKYCGARLDDDDSAPDEVEQAVATDGDSAPGDDEAPVSPASPPVEATSLPADPPVVRTSPLPPATPVGPTPPAPPPVGLAPLSAETPPPNNNKRVLVIIAAVVVVLLVLAVAAVALAVFIPAGTNTSETGSTVTVEKVDATGTTGTLTTGRTGGTADTTTLTIPSYHPGDSAGTVPVTTPGGGDSAPEAYLENLNRLDGVLYDADGKMMAIADKINATTPNLPTSIYEDLMTVGDDVMSSYDWLNAETPPPGYEQAHELILKAGDAMITRIDKTKQGYLAIDGAGATEAGLPFFAEAKAAKDEFTSLYAEYQQARP